MNPPGPLPGEGPEPLDPLEPPRHENPIVGWARAIVLGARDTAEDMLEEGRRGANDAYQRGWQRFDKKTKYRGNRKH